MSILIKGMKMPHNCLYCPLSVLNGERLFCEITNDEVLRSKIAQGCPLVEVPPHGRLIDADEAHIDADERGFDFWACDADIDSAQEFLKAQPTIIEAEGK